MTVIQATLRESAKYGDAIATMPHTADALRRFARRYWFDSNI